MPECYTMSCYDCIHCDRCSDFESGFSAHCVNVSKCKHFRNKADFVEVVRCKDCKYWEEEEGFGMFCSHWASMLTESQPDDFCSCGERRENE